MPYRVEFSLDADGDVRHLGRRDEVAVRRQAIRYLVNEPTAESNKRRRMDPNPLEATWELRLGDIRVYYDLDEAAQLVRVLNVGIKRRERVFIRGREVDLRL